MLLDRVEQEVRTRFSKDIVVTSIIRRSDPASLHAWGKAIDIRVNGKVEEGRIVSGPWSEEDTLTVDEAEAIVTVLNRQYVYDASRPEKKVAVFGDLDPKGNHWNHIHLQGQDYTRMAHSLAVRRLKLHPEVTEVVEDYVPTSPINLGEGPGWLSRTNRFVRTSPMVKMVARRVSKVATAALIASVLPMVGVPQAVAMSLGLAYMPVEKGLNTKVEEKTGKPVNFDLWSILVFLWKLFTTRKEVN